MSDKGEVFVSIDTAAIEAILAQLQAIPAGPTGPIGPEGPVGPQGPQGTQGSSAPKTTRPLPPRVPGYTPDGGQGPYGIRGEYIPSIPRVVRTAAGMAIPGGYELVRDYNLLRWGQRGLFSAQRGLFHKYDPAETRAGMPASDFFTAITAPILLLVMIRQLYDDMNAQKEAMKKLIEQMTGVSGDVYDRWLKIQSDPLLRRNI